jgi:hypothetical protein
MKNKTERVQLNILPSKQLRDVLKAAHDKFCETYIRVSFSAYVISLIEKGMILDQREMQLRSLMAAQYAEEQFSEAKK